MANIAVFLLFAIGGMPQDSIVLTGLVLESGTTEGVPSVNVVVSPWQATTSSDRSGAFQVTLPGPGRVSLHLSRLGYQPGDTTLVIAGDTSVVVALVPRPIELGTLAASGLRTRYARSGRELFEAEVQTGVVGMSRAEVAAVPAFGEVDVLRALQALPGVVPVNDMAATLHVMGGGPDQNVFLWDGARVYAPYHMFGILGAFPAAAVDGVEFYRGALPARYADGLSSVVDIHQGRAEDGFFADGSAGLIAAGLTAGGPLPVGDGGWMIGGRRTHAHDMLLDLTGREFPLAFHDAHGQVRWAPSAAHHVQASFLTTFDRFASGIDERVQAGELDLRTRWSNRVASASWDWLGSRWAGRLRASWSEYGGEIEVGDYRGDYLTTDSLRIGEVEVELGRELEMGTLQMGAGVQHGNVGLVGSEDGAGGYIDGERRGAVAVVGTFAQLAIVRGRFQFVPALRVDTDLRRKEVHVQPRFSARFSVNENLSGTVGIGRNVQRLQTIYDARTVLPGAPLWIALADDEPVAIADGVSVQLDWWSGRMWSFDAGGYVRRLRNVPAWFPEGSRTLEALRFDDGRAAGIQFSARRHGERLSGWLAYGLATVDHRDEEAEAWYHPPWDRRHSLDAAVFSRLPWGAELSARISYGTGTPFWPFAGHQVIARLSTLHGQLMWEYNDLAPYWSDTQMRMPAYFRLDLGARWEFRVRNLRFEPFANILNVTGRPNVLYYRAYNDPAAGFQERPQLVPVTSSQADVIPSFGINVFF